jgi:hypothetical protein
MTFDDLIEFVKAVTGRDATAEELEEARRKWDQSGLEEELAIKPDCVADGPRERRVVGERETADSLVLPDWTADEWWVLELVAKSHGLEWTMKHSSLVLGQAAAIGEIADRPELSRPAVIPAWSPEQWKALEAQLPARGLEWTMKNALLLIQEPNAGRLPF